MGKSRIHIAFPAAVMILSGCLGEKSNPTAPIWEKPDGHLRVFAGEDTVVTALDSVRLRPRITQSIAAVTRWEWDFGDGQGFRASANGDVSFLSAADSGGYPCIVRVTDAEGISARDTLVVAVDADRPKADAGADTTVTLRDTVRLHAGGFDKLGKLRKFEWNLGSNGDFVAASPETSVTARESFGFDRHILRVTDDDGNTALDTMVVRVIDDFPRLGISTSEKALGEGGGAKLSSNATDAGRIVKWEWDMGVGTYAAGSPDTVFHPSQPEGTLLLIKARVTDDDGNTAVDSMRWPVTSWHTYDHVRPEAPAGTDEWRYSACAHGGKVYAYRNVVAASENGSASFDIGTGKWSRETPLPAGLKGNTVVDLDGALYSVGGRFLTSPTGAGLMYEFVPGLDEWFPRRELPSGAIGSRGIVAGGTIYAAAFEDDLFGVNADWAPVWSARYLAIHRYDRKSDTWAKIAITPLVAQSDSTGAIYSRLLQGVAEVGGEFLVFASYRRKIQVYRYSLSKDEWKPGALLDADLDHPGVVAVAGHVYLLGGNVYKKSAFYRYDPVADVWAEKIPSGHGTNYASPVALDGKIYNLSDDSHMQQYEP